MANEARFPAWEQPIDPVTKLFTVPVLTWFRNIRSAVENTPQQVQGGKVTLAAQTATIGTTAIPTGTLVAGLYRLSAYVQVVTAAGVSSDFQLTVSWTTNSVTQTETFALVNTNTTATHQASIVPLLDVDAGTPVSYSLTYNSNPAAAMAYDLSIVLELVSAA